VVNAVISEEFQHRHGCSARIVERLQQSNWVIQRGPTAPLAATPTSYSQKAD
jgi:hypothetical protein